MYKYTWGPFYQHGWVIISIIKVISQLGPWFSIKMTSYQYRKSHHGDRTILRPSYLHNGISYTGKMTSLYWIKAQADRKMVLLTAVYQIFHYCDVIMDTIAPQITSLMIVYSTVYSGADQRKHQSSASLAFVWGIHRWQRASNAEKVSIWWRHHA